MSDTAPVTAETPDVEVTDGPQVIDVNDLPLAHRYGILQEEAAGLQKANAHLNQRVMALAIDKVDLQQALAASQRDLRALREALATPAEEETAEAPVEAPGETPDAAPAD